MQIYDNTQDIASYDKTTSFHDVNPIRQLDPKKGLGNRAKNRVLEETAALNCLKTSHLFSLGQEGPQLPPGAELLGLAEVERHLLGGISRGQRVAILVVHGRGGRHGCSGASPGGKRRRE